MLKKIPAVRMALSAIGVGSLLGGCTHVVPVKEVTADKAGYLAKNFSPQQLPSSILKKLPSDGKSAGFGKLTITTEVTSEESGGKKDSWKSVATLVDAGNGFVQRMVEVSNNDIPYGLAYSLTYKGVVSLKWQQVPLNGGVTYMPYEFKDVTRFDAVPSTINREFVVDYTSGTVAQIANFSSAQKACQATRTIPASELHRKLQGQALMLECELRSNGVVQSRSKLALLEEFGVAIIVEETNSSKAIISRVLDVHS